MENIDFCGMTVYNLMRLLDKYRFEEGEHDELI